jgi:hypothetical protein
LCCKSCNYWLNFFIIKKFNLSIDSVFSCCCCCPVVCVLLPLTLTWIYLDFKCLVNEKNGLHQIQVESYQPIKILKDEKKKKKTKKNCLVLHILLNHIVAFVFNNFSFVFLLTFSFFWRWWLLFLTLMFFILIRLCVFNIIMSISITDDFGFSVFITKISPVNRGS